MGGVADPPAYRNGRLRRLAALSLDCGRGGRIRRIPRQCLGFAETGMSGDTPVAEVSGTLPFPPTGTTLTPGEESFAPTIGPG